MKTYYVDNHAYQAKSQREAEKMHTEYVARVLDAASHMPVILHGKATSILVYSIRGDWGYSFIRPGNAHAADLSGGCWGKQSRAMVIRDARRHLAQLEEDLSYLAPTDKEGRYETARLIEWRRLHDIATATMGMTDAQARAYADEHTLVLTAEEWQKKLPEVVVFDPDGWRMNDGVGWFETPINKDEYIRRRGRCTVGNLSGGTEEELPSA